MEWCGSPLRWEKNQDPSSTPEQGWQDGAGGLLLVAAVHETGLLTHFESAIASCLTQISHPQLSPSSRSQRSLLITLCSSSRPGYLCRFFPYNEAIFQHASHTVALGVDFRWNRAQFGKTDLFARLNDWSSLAHCSPQPADQRAGSLVPAGG